MSRVVIALGGNALGQTPQEQQEKVAAAVPPLVSLIEQGHEILVAHGNGPQVGAISLAFSTAARHDPKIPVMDLPECTAMSQGYIGYHLQKGLWQELRRRNLPWHPATVVTQVEVSADDPAFADPQKPIGPFYTEDEVTAIRAAHPDWTVKEDAGRGYRRMVASPVPVGIVEREAILQMLNAELVVIAGGGGGIPVIRRENRLEGVPAVVDKDFAAAALAEAIDAQLLVILTAVERVCLRFGTPNPLPLTALSADDATRFCAAGEFGAGSMLPKVQAAVRFVRSGPGRRAVIASLEHADQAVAGESGTWIHE